MTDPSPQPPPKELPKLSRQDQRVRREAEALRENLRRRKDQARARRAPEKDEAAAD